MGMQCGRVRRKIEQNTKRGEKESWKKKKRSNG